MTDRHRDGWQRAARTWAQGLAATVLVAGWPILSELASTQDWKSVDWGTVGNGLRYTTLTAAASYVQRTLIDPKRDARRARRVSGYLTADAVDRETLGDP